MIEKKTDHAVRNRLLAGVLLLVPFAFTLMVLWWVLGWLRNLLRPIVQYLLLTLRNVAIVDVVPPTAIKAILFVLSLLFLLTIIYVVGAVGQAVIGRKLIALVERLVLGIPLVRNIYTAAKQVIDAVALKPKTAYQSVVLVEFPRPGYKSLGFLTGRFTTPDGRRFCRVFVPTAPNPTSGFLALIPADEVVETDLTIEETFKSILSGGLLAGDRLAAVM
ncbi:MAG: DUF502 domain-containing protein [Phycisphaerae bacterium]|nr:DUF502 domain-containing protein [Phycisphaerae bacterium]